MAQSSDDKGAEEFVIEEEEQPQKKDAVKKGDVERYEVRIGPPVVSGRKVKPLMTGGEKGTGADGQRAAASSKPGEERKGEKGSVSYGSTQQIYKIEDDLRRTRDIVEDLKHTMGIVEGDLRDLKAEMERMSHFGLASADRSFQMTREHTELLEALMAGDPEAAGGHATTRRRGPRPGDRSRSGRCWCRA